MKELKPRYTLTTIITQNPELPARSNAVRQRGYTHEDIYVAGVKYLESISDDGK
jgi:hypothetical protein